MKAATTKSEKPARLPPDTSPRVPVVETLPLEKLVTEAGTQVRSEIRSARTPSLRTPRLLLGRFLRRLRDEVHNEVWSDPLPD